MVVVIALLSGCAKGGDETEQSEAPSSLAASEGNGEKGSMGRYLEHEITLPEAMLHSEYTQRHYMQRLDSGELVVMDTANGMYLSKDQGATWEPKETPWLETYCSNAYISMIALSPDGGAAVIYSSFEETESGDIYDAYVPQYCYVDADGNVKEFTWESKENYIYQFWFGKDGRLYAYTIQGEVYEMDLEGETHKELFQMEGLSEYVCFTKQYMVIFGTRDVVVYDIQGGMLAKEDKILQDFVKDNVGSNKNVDANSYRVVAAEGEQENVIYVAYSGGVYRHVIGGAAMEQVIDGAMNSLGNPMMLLEGFLVLPDNEFIIFYQEPKLCHYIFDPDIPSVPEEEISIYSLEENYTIRQAVSLFQREHPEVYIRYEVGLTKDTALTAEDALKNLNTRLMSGSGPSLLVLDKLPADSYQEKGMLTDLSGIVYDMKENKLFTNLLDACRDEGKLFYVPVRFQLPLLVGDKEELAHIKDLSSLADAVEKLRKENEKGGIIGLLTEEEVLRTLLMTSSGAWIDKKNKALNEEKLTDFLVQARRIYQAEIAGYSKEELEDYQENYQEQWNTGPASEEMPYAVASTHAVDIAREAQKVGVGLSYGMNCEFNLISTLANQKEDFDYQLWQGQVEKGFLPVGMVGICEGAEKNPLVLEFFHFLYSETVQDLDMLTGFPVNETSFASLKENPRPEEEAAGIVLVGERAEDIFSLEVQWSSEKDFARLLGYVKEITNVCERDRRIEELVCEIGAKVLHGSEEPEEAVAEIVKKASIYLAE